MSYTYVVGDIHGCYDKLQDVLDKAYEHYLRLGLEGKATIICLGDYVDRGPQSAQVVKYLRDSLETGKNNLICLKGNHEDMMVEAEDVWFRNGGFETVKSYQDFYPNVWEDMMASDAEWMNSLPTIHWDTHRVYVHAAVNSHAPLEEQAPHANLWPRYPQGFDEPAHGRHIVHGHTPQNKVLLLKNRTNIDTGSCFGGPLTVAVFKDNQPGGPVAILQSD